MMMAADPSTKPRRRKGADAELKAMLRQGRRDAERQAEALAIARAAKAEKRRARIATRQGEKALPKAKAGEKSRPGKGSMALRYMATGQIDGAQYSAAVEYTDLHLRCRDTKVSSYGDARGGGDGSGISEGQMAALRGVRDADRALSQLELPTAALVYAVCVEDWAASDWMRDIGLDANKGLPLLRLGLSELARMWRLPVKGKV